MAHDIMPRSVRGAFNADLDRPRTAPIPGVDGVDAWGPRATDLMGGSHNEERLTSGEFFDEPTQRTVFTLHWREPGADATAFHDPDAIVADVTGLREIEVERDNDPVRLQTVGPTMGTVEFRCYTASSVTEGETEFDPTRSSEATPLLDDAGDEPQGIVVRFCQLFGNALTKPLREWRDPFMAGRLRGSEQAFSVLASHYPDIGETGLRDGQFRAVSKAKAGPVMVFVHGTFSCALPSLDQLPVLRIPIFRFEHDTFRRVSENAADLVGAIDGYAGDATRLYLVGHSRGGLVARLAGLSLEKSLKKKGVAVSVLTFGTPHEGTPAANAGLRLFNVIIGSGRAAVRAIPVWDSVSAAGKLFLSSRLAFHPPPGIVAMRPLKENDFLPTLGVPSSLCSWGGVYDGRKAVHASKSTRYAYSFAKGAFKKERNDLVVGTDSATSVGTAMPALSCNHFEFFGMPDVQSAILDLK